jgi:flagellar hook-basal body complex protein FliE
MINQISQDSLLREMSQIQREMSPEKLFGEDKKSGGFGEALGKLISDVDNSQKEADLSIKKLATGENNSIQDVVMKLEEADVSFRIMKEIRDKILQAYKDLIAQQG